MIPEGVEEWSPKKGAEEWYRNVTSGQRGYKVIREGEPRVRLVDYVNEVTKKLSGEWVPDNEHRPMTSAQIAQVCFEADKKLCHFLGLRENAQKSWIDLHEEKRREWIETGPSKGVRGEMGKAIREILARLME